MAQAYLGYGLLSLSLEAGGGANCIVHERGVQAYLGYGLLSLSLGAGWGSWQLGGGGSVWVRGYPSSGGGAPGCKTVAPVRTEKGIVY